MTKLDQLITQFLDAQKDGNRARWRQVDLAAAVQADAGARGLAQLARACGLSHAYLRMFVQVAHAFPPGTRHIDLSFEHHRAAQRAPRRFPAGSPESAPGYWLDQATAQRYTSDQLYAAMAHHTLASDSVAARQAQAAQRVAEAGRARTHIVDLIAQFNAGHAVFWGAKLVLSEQPLLASAS